jgi:protein-disulfide isomerase
MTFRSALTGAITLLCASVLSLPAAALNLELLSPAEREIFRAEVRDYLMENPEVILEAIDQLRQRQAEAEAMSEQSLVQVNSEAIFNDGVSWVGGNPDGDITIVEFMDYRCGYCKKAFPEVSGMIEDDGNIRIIIKEFPILGDASVLASRFAIATKIIAGDQGYKNVHNALMTMRGDISETSLRRIAEKLSLDSTAIFAAMGSDEINRIPQANRVLGQRLRVSGTPTFVMQDQLVRGYVPAAAMAEIIAELRRN